MRRDATESRPLRSLPDHDLTAHALGRLDPADAERVERALAVDPASRERYERIAAHLARYEVLETPPPPPYASVAARLPGVRRVRRLRTAALAAAAVVVAALALRLLVPHGAPRPETRLGVGIRVIEGGAWIADAEPAEAWIGERVHVVLDANARLAPGTTSGARLLAGRAWLEIEPGAGPFELATAHGPVRVLGTTLEVDVEGAGLFVAVGTGRVEAAGRVLSAGEALVAGRTVPSPHEAGSFFRRPTLGLTVEGTPSPGEPVTLRFTFSNPGRIPIDVAGPDGVRTALWLEVVDPADEVHDVPVPGVDAPHGPLPPGRPVHLPSRGERAFTARVALPARDRGVYRCRALYRPEGQPSVVSDALLLEVR